MRKNVTNVKKEIFYSHRHHFPCLHSVVLGLINHCAKKMVAEVILLIPLLLRLRHPGADATRLGPVVEEENWSGLENVEFRPFRRNMRLHQDKRR